MLEIAKEAALTAGAYLKQRFSQQLFPELESHNDVKLVEDRESESRIIEVIHRHFPDHSIYSEEIGTISRGDEYLWVIDPMDGTNNFFVGHPYFSVSIALEHRGELIVGVVYNPIANQLFWAEKGKGAYLNGTPMHVSNKNVLARATGSYVRGREALTKEQEIETTRDLFLHTKRLMRNYSPALDFCLLANGWLDYIVMEKTNMMDVAAGVLIAQEAGAKMTGWCAEAFTYEAYHPELLVSMIVSGGALQDELCKMMRDYC
ncbi:inositol monophosphatase [Brevibacillus laterosporus]|uniref:inositol monophosphatase family protein n=1 Tax=Brevibacillus laterosporus TaxID=1465 RepID=UPI000BD441D8|nr:inositol monophosphatase [Brevibacillus laterosporus]PCN43389.1 inositol monophosphatase [Brevibacillus laterosporus]